MENNNYKLGSIVIMKKQHPCGTNKWKIVRVGSKLWKNSPNSSNRI